LVAGWRDVNTEETLFCGDFTQRANYFDTSSVVGVVAQSTGKALLGLGVEVGAIGREIDTGPVFVVLVDAADNSFNEARGVGSQCVASDASQASGGGWIEGSAERTHIHTLIVDFGLL